ncbi:hypothetical protein TNCV_883401 [Trichonephila clavipes]|nr:hypothetical protein TNCV_883401 [Trichonephila clavipes]
MHSATVQQPLTVVSPNSNPTIVMLQAEVGFVSKHNVVPFRCPCPSYQWRCKRLVGSRSDKAPRWSPAVFLAKFAPIIGQGYQHSLVNEVAFPLYPNHAPLKSDLAGQGSV